MYSLTNLIQSLISVGNNKVREQEFKPYSEEGRKEITSIRLKPGTKNYLRIQSDVLGISVSQLINLIVDGVAETELNAKKSEN